MIAPTCVLRRRTSFMGMDNYEIVLTFWQKPCRLRVVFLLKVFPPYISLKAAVRTGNFKLQISALRRIAPIICMTGEDRNQSLAAHHLLDVAAMPDGVLDVLSVRTVLREYARQSLGWQSFDLD